MKDLTSSLGKYCTMVGFVFCLMWGTMVTFILTTLFTVVCSRISKNCTYIVHVMNFILYVSRWRDS